MNILKDYNYYHKFNDKLTIGDYYFIKDNTNFNEIKSIDDYVNIDSVLRTFRKLSVFV